MAQDNEKYILYGPVPHMATPEESMGIQIYNSLRSDPNKEIFIDALTEKTIRVHELLDITCKLAQALSNCGYNEHDVIAVCSENSTNFFIPVIAAFYQGICCAPLNHSYSEYELQHVLDISKPKVVFCSAKCSEKLVNLKKKTAPYVQKIVVFDLEENVSGAEDFDEFVAKNCNAASFNVDHFKPIDVNTREHLALIMCSSGTTGLPKGVMLTHRNVSHRMVQANDERFYLNFPEVTYTAVLPFFHAGGFFTGLSHIIHKQRAVLMARFKEDLFLEAIQKYRITHLWLVPPIVVFLTKSPLVQKYDLSSIREIGCGAANLSKEVQEKLGKLFNSARMMQAFGMTETTLAILITPVGVKKCGSSGKVVSGMSMKVRDVATGENLPAGAVGELCAKGELVMKGYFGNEEATRNTFHDGWLLTGDLGYYDDEGFFYVVDRLKELIKYKGFQVAPAELEALLLSNPKIKDAAVVGVPDEAAGELPCAFVVKQTGAELSEDEVKAIVADQLSHQKQLRGGVRFVDEIPKSATGKIDRKTLRAAVLDKNL